MSERRYSESEVDSIFRAASERQQMPGQLQPGEQGMSLAELQSIGEQAGISSDVIAQAARSLDVRGESPSRTLLGLPIGVSRTVDLNRSLADDEWDRLVAHLRDVFDAYGKTRSDGASRQWSNGNLRVVLEPSESGHRLRFRTMNGGARSLIVTGLAFVGVTGAMAAAAALGGNLASAGAGVGTLAIVGMGMITMGAIRLPRWARLRGQQMESVADKFALPPD